MAPHGASAGGRVRIFHGLREVPALPADDRGHAYGDGLFETLRAHGGDAPWWDAHWVRLARGAARLAIALPPQALARDAMRSLLADGDGGGVVRLQVARGPSARGYAPDPGAEPVWTLSSYPAPAPAKPLALRWCRTRLAIQPALAGMKHCNRLEQVLARAEWLEMATDADEGLMLDTEGAVTCATSANVFIHAGGRWLTPVLDRNGVQGVCRGWIIPVAGAMEARLSPADVENADAVFLCNAVRGILEVARLGDRTWSPDARIARLRARLAAAHPAFAPAPESL